MKKIDVFNVGHVILEDHYGDDLTIVNAARQSFNQTSDTLGEREEGLINYLMREKHGTPFEMVDFRFNIKAPIFVVREWQRHRIASYNELSGRYKEMPNTFYVPALEDLRTQTGKPGAYKFEPLHPKLAEPVRDEIEQSQREAWSHYASLLRLGVAKEQARIVLPISIMTQMTFKINLRSLLNFNSLRSAAQAMYEIRVYSKAIEELIKPVVPIAMQAFENNQRVAP